VQEGDGVGAGGRGRSGLDGREGWRQEGRRGCAREGCGSEGGRGCDHCEWSGGGEAFRREGESLASIELEESKRPLDALEG